MTVTIHQGDCRNVMRAMADGSVHCCVTSPPYFGLRDYGHEAQIGLEATPDAFVAEMVAVFREVRRVLRDDGTLWLNLGDSYCSTDKWGGGGNVGKNTVAADGSVPSWAVRSRKPRMPGIKPKDLIGIPWRVAFALQADGWYLRQDIIWHKPNPMPESVRDRCTKAHEYIFLLSKRSRYAFDADAIKEPGLMRRAGNTQHKYISDDPQHRTKPGVLKMKETVHERVTKRSVWKVAPQPFKGSHFATFPPALIEPCILAGCPKGGVVLDPFGGAGTTGLVATRLGRDAVLIELNADYVEMSHRRIDADDRKSSAVRRKPHTPRPIQSDLFMEDQS